jgi:hypothetical protein
LGLDVGGEVADRLTFGSDALSGRPQFNHHDRPDRDQQVGKQGAKVVVSVAERVRRRNSGKRVGEAGAKGAMASTP